MQEKRTELERKGRRKRGRRKRVSGGWQKTEKRGGNSEKRRKNIRKE